jgi:hypothetical protein
MKRFMSCAGWVLLLPLAAWCVTAVLLGGGGPDDPGWLRWSAAVLFAATPPVAAWKAGRKQALILTSVLCAMILGWFFSIRPSTDRQWSPDQERLPWAEIDGSLVTLHDIRDFRYRSTTDWDEHWYDAVFDLEQLEGLDLFVVHFSESPAIGHTLLSFRFAGDRFVTFSAEIRRERGEEYSALRGLYRQYELMYIAGDERDLVRLRTHHRKNTVYRHPLGGTRETRAAAFLDIVRRCNELRDRPVFYNTLANNCTTNLVRHYERVNDEELPLDSRWILAGGADEVAFELGMIDTDTGFEETRRRNRIDRQATQCGDRESYSLCIRGESGP